MSEIDLNEFFGDAKAGGSDTNWKTHGIKENEDNVYRIAPSVKSCRQSGKWKIYYKVHYGYTVPNDQNPDKPRHKPFLCIEKKNRATGMLEQDCPECNMLAAKEKEIEALKAKALAAGKTEEQAEEFVKSAKKLLHEHNLDKKWYVLAKNLAGEWGVLKIPFKAMQKLDLLMDRYAKQNDGESALKASGGVWFRFTRSGKNINTVYDVEIEQESLGKGNFRQKSGELTKSDAEAIDKCPDLATINDNKAITYDQVAALVTSNGDPTIVATVFGTPTKSNTPAPKPSTQFQESAPEPEPEDATPTTQVDEEAELEAKLAKMKDLKAKAAAERLNKEKAATKQQVTVTAPTQSFSDLMSLDPQQFLNMFPDPNKK